MKFIPSRELRLRPGKVWKDLRAEGELVVTRNGQPVALMLPVNGEDLEDRLRAVRAGELREAVDRVRQEAAAKRLDRMSSREVDDLVRRARRGSRR
jgi:antitoxin (DNA-binding transcriptional repressor) of toxin-antitoxin stability system